MEDEQKENAGKELLQTTHLEICIEDEKVKCILAMYDVSCRKRNGEGMKEKQNTIFNDVTNEQHFATCGLDKFDILSRL